MEKHSCKNSCDISSFSFSGPTIWTEVSFEEKASELANIPFKIRFNNNKSVYLRLLRKTPYLMQLSLQRFFLYAPVDICQALVNYLCYKSNTARKLLHHFVRAYYHQEDLSSDYDQDDLWYKGETFNLKEAFARVNEKFFNNSIEGLSICYFPRPQYKKCRSITWGVYDRAARLIRINNMLDHPLTPEYFVDFIVYHEMLHHVSLPKHVAMRKTIYHTTEFRRLEKAFPEYEKVKVWEKQFFTKTYKQMRKNYGRP